MNRFLSSLNPKYMYTSRSYFTLNLVTNIIACLCIIMLSSCNKDPYQDGTPELPPITMEGKNTFGCKINEEIWIPFVKNPSQWNQAISINLDETSGKKVFRFTMKKRHDNINENLSFQIVNPRDGSNKQDNIIAGIYNFLGSTSNCPLFEMVDSTRFVLINKIDYDSRIISGTFTFNKFINECGDSTKITDGRFDLKF